MADKKISQLTAATTPLAGTEVLPIVQSGSTVKVASDDLTVKNVRSNATTGILQVAGPGAGTTRVMTVPNANFTAARTDAAQTFSGVQTFSGSAGSMVVDSFGAVQAPVGVYVNTTGIRSAGVSSGGTDLRFRLAGADDRVIFDDSGNITCSIGNFKVGTAGKGIDFSANTHAAGMTSELLDWYEEGTFTPTLQGSTGNPTPTYTAQVGTYTRIGNIVYVWIQVYTSAVSGGTGDLRIGDLPFSTNASYGARFIVTCTRVDFSATATYVNAAVDGSSNKIYLTETNDNSNDTVVPISAWNAGAAAGVSISGFYFV